MRRSPKHDRDTRDILIESWKTANQQHKLSTAEERQSELCTTARAFSEYILQEQAEARRAGQIWKVGAGSISSGKQLLRSLSLFETLLEDLVINNSKNADQDDELDELKFIDSSPLWRHAFLHVKVNFSCES